ncbi:MAG: tyrosine--tRNA ligase [Candidatus Methanoplasma sp.]|jgi:tyrosyl-tRNA synthetase|nr:tyrosine--tRNA ligase [Candidatus Methanoplasma sp.]
MDIEQRMAIVTRNAEELVTEEELRELLSKKGTPRAYIGFEPSGLVHLGWALVTSKIRDLADAGFETIIFWADWHAYINDKLGGDLENIRICAGYMEDCFVALGVPKDKVNFVYASEILSDIEYWEKVIKVAKATTLSRVKRAMTIMGRSEDEAEVDFSKLIYPILQATDIFCMDIDLAYAGIDQRRAHMLARDAAEKLGWKKPVALHTPLIPGLKGGDRMNPAAAKMSKSDPGSSINIHDDDDAVKNKIKKAFCPPEKEKEDENPVLMLCRYIIFPRLGKMDVSRPEKFGGDISFSCYEDMAGAYFSGSLFPLDLKNGVADSLIMILGPVREYFQRNPENYAAMKKIFESADKLR